MPALLALAQQQGVPPLASRTKALHRSLAHHITDCMRALRPLPTVQQYAEASNAVQRWALGSEHEVSRLWALTSLLHSRAAAFVGAAIMGSVADDGPAEDSLGPAAMEALKMVRVPKYVALVQAVQVVVQVLDVPQTQAS